MKTQPQSRLKTSMKSKGDRGAQIVYWKNNFQINIWVYTFSPSGVTPMHFCKPYDSKTTFDESLKFDYKNSMKSGGDREAQIVNSWNKFQKNLWVYNPLSRVLRSAAFCTSPMAEEHWWKEGKLGANAMKLVAAGAHLPTPWLFEPAKCPDDRDCWDCGFLP